VRPVRKGFFALCALQGVGVRLQQQPWNKGKDGIMAQSSKIRCCVAGIGT
jgi:hypothetical protein